MKNQYFYNGQLVSEWETPNAAPVLYVHRERTKNKPIDQMTYQELQEHGRKLLADCSGCNKQDD